MVPFNSLRYSVVKGIALSTCSLSKPMEFCDMLCSTSLFWCGSTGLGINVDTSVLPSTKTTPTSTILEIPA